MTGLTQDGNSVASSSYDLYGSTTETTDTTGNPFAYNGEARDVTGFDYLRARYYDSSAGAFLTQDSYQGELTDPLSQNQYSYVHNNPVNYTDPSGHFWNGIKKAWNKIKRRKQFPMLGILSSELHPILGIQLRVHITQQSIGSAIKSIRLLIGGVLK